MKQAASKEFRSIARKLLRSPRVRGILQGILDERKIKLDLTKLDFENAIDGLATVLEERQMKKATTSPYGRDCPACGAPIVSTCRCASRCRPHDLDALQRGHGDKCKNGHISEPMTNLVIDAKGNQVRHATVKLASLKRRFNLHEYRWNSEVSKEDLAHALLLLFDEVAHDLGVTSEDPSDPAFLDFAGDTMHDRKVPDNMIDAALAWLKGGAKQKRVDRKWVLVGFEDAKQALINPMTGVDFHSSPVNVPMTMENRSFPGIVFHQDPYQSPPIPQRPQDQIGESYPFPRCYCPRCKLTVNDWESAAPQCPTCGKPLEQPPGVEVHPLHAKLLHIAVALSERGLLKQAEEALAIEEELEEDEDQLDMSKSNYASEKVSIKYLCGAALDPKVQVKCRYYEPGLHGCRNLVTKQGDSLCLSSKAINDARND